MKMMDYFHQDNLRVNHNFKRGLLIASYASAGVMCSLIHIRNACSLVHIRNACSLIHIRNELVN